MCALFNGNMYKIYEKTGFQGRQTWDRSKFRILKLSVPKSNGFQDPHLLVQAP